MSLKLETALGFSMRAGKLICGDFAVTKAVKGGKAKLVIVDNESSEQTKKKWHNACEYRSIPLYEIISPGRAAGKPDKMIFAVTDEGFYNMIAGAYNAENGQKTDKTGNNTEVQS